MTPSPDSQSPRLPAWIAVSLAPLLATAPSLAGSIALAAAIPAVLFVAVLASRVAHPSLGSAARVTAIVLVAAAASAAIADALAALLPSVGDGPARWLPLAIALAWCAVVGRADVEAAPLRALAMAAVPLAASTLVLALARDWAGRVSHVALSPAGAFVAIGVSLALARAIAESRGRAIAAAERRS